MMKLRLFPSLIPSIILSASLIAALLAACSSAATASVPVRPVGVSPTLAVPTDTVTAGTVPQETLSPSGTLAPTPFPVVTSRGPHLEATDPKTVSMASEGLQFVEFFEFW